MSEIVHYKGEIIPTGKTVAEIDALFDTDEELEIYYETAIAFEGYVYRVTDFGLVNRGEDIAEARRLPSGKIEFELKYYNGGAHWTEVMEEALQKMNDKTQ
jgi:hypothetical protein